MFLFKSDVMCDKGIQGWLFEDPEQASLKEKDRWNTTTLGLLKQYLLGEHQITSIVYISGPGLRSTEL